MQIYCPYRENNLKIIHYIPFSESSDDECESLTLEALTARLTELRGLTKELEDIRTLLQEQHAHQLAKDVYCAQM